MAKKVIVKNDISQSNRRKERQVTFLECLKQSKGVILLACLSAKINRDTVYGWMENDKDFYKKVKEIRDVPTAIAEKGLAEALESKRPWAVMFDLSRRHPEFMPKQKIEIEGEKLEDIL